MAHTIIIMNEHAQNYHTVPNQITDISFVSLDLLLANHGIHEKGVLLIGVIFDEPRIDTSY